MAIVLLHDFVRNEFSELLTTFFNEKTIKRRELEKQKQKYLKAIRKRKLIHVFDPPELCLDQDFALSAVKIDGCMIRRFSSIVNERIAIAAIQNNPKASNYLKETFWSNRDLSLLALRLAAPNFPYNGTRRILWQYCEDRQVVLEVARQHHNHYVSVYCKQMLSEDREIAARAVSANSSMMASIGETFRNDRTFVEEMIRTTRGSAFYHVRNIFGNDREIVELAVRENPSTFSFIGSEIVQDRSFILKLVEILPFFVFNLPLFMHDREIILKCLENYPTAITSIPIQFRNDREMAMECMKRDSTVFSLQNFTFRNDKEMALMYLKENPQGFATICEELRSDRQVVEFVSNIRPDLALKYGLVQDREIAVRSVEKDWSLLGSVQCQDRDMVLEAMKLCPVAGLLANKELRMDMDVLKEILLSGLLDFLLTLQQYDL